MRRATALENPLWRMSEVQHMAAKREAVGGGPGEGWQLRGLSHWQHVQQLKQSLGGAATPGPGEELGKTTSTGECFSQV